LFNATLAADLFAGSWQMDAAALIVEVRSSADETCSVTAQKRERQRAARAERRLVTATRAKVAAGEGPADVAS
jgi:hypothetical protein